MAELIIEQDYIDTLGMIARIDFLVRNQQFKLSQLADMKLQDGRTPVKAMPAYKYAEADGQRIIDLLDDWKSSHSHLD